MVEVPVQWSHDPDTRIRMLRDSLRMFGELLSIRWNWFLGRYSEGAGMLDTSNSSRGSA
jgi:hypothetical protein